MECKVEGRTKTTAQPNHPLDYGLRGMTPGQQKWEFIRAGETLQRIMMDPDAPEQMKQLIREQNAIGMIFLQQMLAVHYVYETRHGHGA